MAFFAALSTDEPVVMDFNTFRNNASDAKKGLLRQRKDIGNRITSLEQEVKAANAELARIDGEISAMDAFESALAGIPASQTRRGRPPGAKAGAKRGRRKAPKRGRIGRKSIRRLQILEIINGAGPDGIKRSDVIAALEERGDAIDNKSAKQSVSNALAALKNSGEVGHDGNMYRGAAT